MCPNANATSYHTLKHIVSNSDLLTYGKCVFDEDKILTISFSKQYEYRYKIGHIQNAKELPDYPWKDGLNLSTNIPIVVHEYVYEKYKKVKHGIWALSYNSVLGMYEASYMDIELYKKLKPNYEVYSKNAEQDGSNGKKLESSSEKLQKDESRGVNAIYNVEQIKDE